MRCDVGEVTERLENEQSSFSSLSIASPTSQIILQSFRRFIYVTAYSPTLPLLHLRHSSFFNPSFAFPTSQVLHLELILQPFHRFTYVTTHSPILPSLYLRHSSFSNPSVASPTSQLILQPFRRFTYVTAHSPTLLSLFLRHSSFSNPSFAFPTSQVLHLRHLASRPCLPLSCAEVIANPRYFHFLFVIPQRSDLDTLSDHRCGRWVTSLSLTLWARVRSPVGSVFYLRVFRGFPQL